MSERLGLSWEESTLEDVLGVLSLRSVFKYQVWPWGVLCHVQMNFIGLEVFQ